MALDPLNKSSSEQLAFNGLIKHAFISPADIVIWRTDVKKNVHHKNKQEAQLPQR